MVCQKMKRYSVYKTKCHKNKQGGVFMFFESLAIIILRRLGIIK